MYRSYEQPDRVSPYRLQGYQTYQPSGYPQPNVSPHNGAIAHEDFDL